MESIQWRYTKETVLFINKQKYPFLSICGPSGAGKTFLASFIESNYNGFSIVRNYTTRAARPSDNINHFAYITPNEFDRLDKQDDFFMCRKGEYPWYGYRNEDILSIVSNERIPVFMFRQSGTEQISRLIHNSYIIIIETDVYKSSANSKDIVHKATATKHIDCYNNIERTALSLSSSHVLNIFNSYTEDFVRNINLQNFLGEIINDRPAAGI